MPRIQDFKPGDFGMIGADHNNPEKILQFQGAFDSFAQYIEHQKSRGQTTVIAKPLLDRLHAHAAGRRIAMFLWRHGRGKASLFPAIIQPDGSLCDFSTAGTALPRRSRRTTRSTRG